MNNNKIIIDIRESDLLSKMKTMSSSSFSIESSPLDIGDIHFIINGIEYAIIERKTLKDLASSIKDGRYEEQSYRLNGYSLHNHHISYLIEGDVTKWNDSTSSISRSTLYSAMTSLQYAKGFSVIRTFHLEDTAQYIHSSFVKLCKIVNEKPLFYLSTEEEIKSNYCSVIKKTKKENITSENMSEIILSQIPGISAITATAITAKYNTIPILIAALQENPSVLQELQYMNTKGQMRKINKNTGETIIKYLSIHS